MEKTKKKQKQPKEEVQEQTPPEEFDPQRLQVTIGSQVRSFAEWTLAFALHYYPQVGTKTYRVPPVDFNKQLLSKQEKEPGYTALQGSLIPEDVKKYRSQATVGQAFYDLGKHLEKSADHHRKGLFIVANVEYENYLKELRRHKNRVDAKGTQPPYPNKIMNRGEMDLLVLHPEKGIFLIEIKGIGLDFKPNTFNLQDSVRKTVNKAADQLVLYHRVFDYINNDLDLKCAVHKVVAVPYISRECLKTSLKEEAATSNLLFLCSDDIESAQDVINWWNAVVKGEHCSGLSDHQLQSIVGRHCGLLSTVSVWSNSSPPFEVRDVAEGVHEVGGRFARIVLTEEQQRALECKEKLVFLHGPPGTGKTITMEIKARQWLKDNQDVCVLNLDLNQPGLPVGLYTHDRIARWLDQAYKGQAAPKLIRKDFDVSSISDHVDQMVTDIQQQTRPGKSFHFITDEFYFPKEMLPVFTRLRKQFPDSCFWCAEMNRNSAPEDFHAIQLTKVLRCPGNVQELLQHFDWEKTHRDFYTKDSTVHGLPTDGFKPQVIRHKGHCAKSPLDCGECANLLIRLFREDLKIDFGRKISKDKIPLPSSKTKKRSGPRRIPLSDIAILVSYPQVCMVKQDDPNLMKVGPDLRGRFYKVIETSTFLATLKKAGLPVKFLSPEKDVQELAFPPDDQLMVSVTNSIIGLERKVVVYVPCESASYTYPLTPPGQPASPQQQSAAQLLQTDALESKRSAPMSEGLCTPSFTKGPLQTTPAEPERSSATSTELCQPRLPSAQRPEETSLPEYRTTSVETQPVSSSTSTNMESSADFDAHDIPTKEVPCPSSSEKENAEGADGGLHEDSAPHSRKETFETWGDIDMGALEHCLPSTHGVVYAASRTLALFVVIEP